MATTITPTTIAEKNNITVAQLSAATHCVLNAQHIVIVESASTPGLEYKVVWNAEHSCMQCLPHNGPACRASELGKCCWHKRAAMACLELEKEQTRREHLNEQATVEATEEYVYEQAVATLTWAMANLDRLEQEAMTLQELYKEDDRILAEYEQIEDAYERARRRADFQLAAKYQAMLDQLEPRVEEAMHRQASIA